MRRVEGVVTGIVKQIDAERGRLRLEFPWLEASYRSHWAPIAAPMSGNNRGMFMMPEIDDEVLVACEHGCIDHPFVIGFLWNGVDKCPHDSTGPSVRRLRTVSGHVIEFDDRDGQERILIRTQGNHEIEMKDGISPSITITSNGGQAVTLTDTAASLTVEARGGVTIKAPILTVDAPVASFTGTLQAVAIVSGAYTPAPGNTLGL